MYLLKYWELSISLCPCGCSPNRDPLLELGQDNPQTPTNVLTRSLERGQNDPQMFPVTSPVLATALQPWLRPLVIRNFLNKPILIIGKLLPSAPPFALTMACNRYWGPWHLMLSDPATAELKFSCYNINCSVRVYSWGDSSLVIGLQGPTTATLFK